MPGRSLPSVTRVASIFAAFLLIGAVVSPAVASSNKTIQIDEDLRVNAEVLNVSIGTSTPAHQVNIKFGEYSVVSSKVREGGQTTTSEFLSPVAHTRIRNYFTFVLTGAASTTAKVKAEWNILSEKPGHCLEIDLGIGADIEYCLGDEEPRPGLHDLVVATVQIDGEAASPVDAAARCREERVGAHRAGRDVVPHRWQSADRDPTRDLGRPGEESAGPSGPRV